MGRDKNVHYRDLPEMLASYSSERSLDYNRYSDYHMRIMDGGFTTLDIWTTARYYVLSTDYNEQKADKKMLVIERGGEKGFIPTTSPELDNWLDKLFFATEIERN